tara:strand:+ start:59 stop:640 length:582 start_codon:yes stop_codon:yes gene_type:complete
MKFKMKKLQENCPVMIVKIPDLIMKEIDIWVDECKKIKEHPLAELKNLREEALENDYFRINVPESLVKESFWLPWILKLCSEYVGNNATNRDFKLITDDWGVWTNFYQRGNRLSIHDHDGDLSGVIYYKNHDHPTFFDEYDIGYEGIDGTMVLFPSDTLHQVKEQLSDEERITISFNILQNPKLKNKSDLQYQ